MASFAVQGSITCIQQQKAIDTVDAILFNDVVIARKLRNGANVLQVVKMSKCHLLCSIMLNKFYYVLSKY